MKLLNELNWNEVMANALATVENDFKELGEELGEGPDREMAERAGERLATEIIALARSETPEEEAERRERIEFLKGTLESLAAVAEMKLYNRTVETVGNVMGATVAGIVKGML